MLHCRRPRGPSLAGDVGERPALSTRSAAFRGRLVHSEQPTLSRAVRVSQTTRGRSVTILFASVLVAAGGCASRRAAQDAAFERTAPTPVRVETNGAHVVQASMQAGTSDASRPTTRATDDPDQDIAVTPQPHLARLPPPKIIPDGEK